METSSRFRADKRFMTGFTDLRRLSPKASPLNQLAAHAERKHDYYALTLGAE